MRADVATNLSPRKQGDCRLVTTRQIPHAQLMQFSIAQLILPDTIQRGSIDVRDGRIRQVSRTGKKTASAKTFDLKGGFLAPGFIDLHSHGAMGHDTMEATEDAFRVITDFHLRGGTTSLTLTTLTAPEESILKVLRAVKPLHNRSLGGARIVGVHVEGPFIALGKAGAQDPKQIRPPQAREWKKFLRFGKRPREVILQRSRTRSSRILQGSAH